MKQTLESKKFQRSSQTQQSSSKSFSSLVSGSFSPEMLIEKIMSSSNSQTTYTYSATTVTKRNGVTDVNIKKHHYNQGALKIEEFNAHNADQEVFHQSTQSMLNSMKDL